MKKFILPLAVLILLLPAVASTEQISFFPLEKGRTWVFDNGNQDHIAFFKKIDSAADNVTANNTGNSGITIFGFDSYNNFERNFFVEDNKVYEWKNGYSRIWYSFGANPGDTWKMEWVKSSNLTDPTSSSNGTDNTSTEPDDINTGAIVTLIANNELVSTPYGDFKNCRHFRIERPGVADAGYVEEWFAENTGCVMRVWDSIAGPQQTKLAKLYTENEGETPGTPGTPLKLDMSVSFNKYIYNYGEDVIIEVSAYNATGEDVTIKFPTSLQIDYTIDNEYRYSENHEFTQAETEVTIPAHDAVKWALTHTQADFLLKSDKHFIQAELVGTETTAYSIFIVNREMKTLPEGVVLSLKTDKSEYLLGEPVKFTLSAVNTTTTDVTIGIQKAYPIYWSMDEPSFYYSDTEAGNVFTDTIIPASESLSWEQVIDSDAIFLSPGDHTFYAGIISYKETANTSFTIKYEAALSKITGKVVEAIKDSVTGEDIPVAGANVVLKTFIPEMYEKEMSVYPLGNMDEWKTTTDETGAFTIQDLPLGVFYYIEISKEGFLPYIYTIRLVSEGADLFVELKKVPDVSDEEIMNYKGMEISGLYVTVGTNSSVYQPDSEFKAFMNIKNETGSAVNFKFDSDEYVQWKLTENSTDDVVWHGGAVTDSTGSNGGGTDMNNSSKGMGGKGTEKNSGGMNMGGGKMSRGDGAHKAVVYELIMNPGDSKDFEFTGSFNGLVPDTGGKYVLTSTLAYSSTSIEGLEPGKITGYVKILIVPSKSNRIEAQGRDNECVVDMKDSLKIYIDILTNKENLNGSLNVSEVKENYHAPWKDNKFIKMVEIDADSMIRAGMDSALVRIYFEPGDYENAEDLTIAHWRDNAAWDDSAGSADWEELESRVDTINNYVEAYTTSFSSFGLFESPKTTGVEDNNVPKAFVLGQNHPNPFNPATTISFTLPSAAKVRLIVYNMLGQEAASPADRYYPAGTHSVVFNGAGLSSGVYFYRLEAGDFTAVRKMLLIK